MERIKRFCKENLEDDISQFPPKILQERRAKGVIARFLLRYSDSISTILTFTLIISYGLMCNILASYKEDDREATKELIAIAVYNGFVSFLFTLELIMKIASMEYFFFNRNYNGYFYILCDIIAGPFALSTDIIHYCLSERIGYHGNSLRMLKIFSLMKLRYLLAEIVYIIPRCSGLLFSIFFVFYIFSYIGHELFRHSFPQFFGTMPNAMLSMFQVLTQDSWNNQIVQPIIRIEGFMSSFFFTAFILLMFYTFLNIFLGIFVTYYSTPHLKKNMSYCYAEDTIANEDLKQLRKNSVSYDTLLQNVHFFHQNLYLDKIIQTFDKIIYYYWFFTIIKNYLINYFEFGNLFEIIMEFFFGILFTAHTLLLLLLSDWITVRLPMGIKFPFPKYVLTSAFLLDLVSGPLALGFDAFDLQNQSRLKTGPVLRIFKLLNTLDNQAINKRLIKIFPKVLPALVLVLSIINYYAFFGTIFLSSAENKMYFVNLHQSFLTLVQIMTLDDWSKIARNAYEENPYYLMFFVSFLLIVTFFLVNIITGLLTKASEDITEKIFEVSVKENEMIPKDEYGDLLRDIKKEFARNNPAFAPSEKKFVEELSPEEREKYDKLNSILENFHDRVEEKRKPGILSTEIFLTIKYQGQSFRLYSKDILRMRDS